MTVPRESRTHYARTCYHWAERLRANQERAIALVGERKYRTRLLYLTSSSVGFEQASIGLHQILAHKMEAGAPAIPTTREAIYAERPAPLARAAGMR